MACTNMVQGQMAKIKKVSDTFLNKARALDKKRKKQAQEEAKRLGRRWNPTQWDEEESTVLRIQRYIQAGTPAQNDKIGSGEDHQHVFRWGNIFVPVTECEYEKSYQQITNRSL